MSYDVFISTEFIKWCFDAWDFARLIIMMLLTALVLFLRYMLHRIFAWTKQEVVNSRLDAWSVGGSWYQMSIFFFSVLLCETKFAQNFVQI